MKRILFACLALSVSLFFGSCAGTSPQETQEAQDAQDAPETQETPEGAAAQETLDEFLSSRALSLTADMDEMAESPVYISLLSANEELTAIAEDMGAQDYTSPKAVYALRLPEDYASRILASMGEDYSALSPKMQDIVSRRVGTSLIPNQLAAMNGASYLAAASMLSQGENYLLPEAWEPGQYLVILLYDGDYASLVSFVESGEGIVSASGTIVLSSGTFEDVSGTADISSLMEEFLSSPVEVWAIPLAASPK